MHAGRPAAAERVLVELDALPDRSRAVDHLRIDGAVYWDGDREAAEGAVRRLAGSGSDEPVDLYRLATWRIEEGDAEGAAALSGRLKDGGSAYGVLGAQTLEVRLGRLTGDPRLEALARALEASVRESTAAYALRAQANLTLARVFEELGDPPRALAASRRILWNVGGDLYATTFLRAEGRLAAALGERDAARRACSFYLAVRSDPEPALAPETARVRAELAALSGSAGGR
jgi:hypothetical protein